MKKILIMLLAFLSLTGMIGCADRNYVRDDEKTYSDSGNPFDNKNNHIKDVNYSDAPAESVLQRIGKSILEGETNISEKLSQPYHLSDLTAGNMLHSYVLEDDKFVKQVNSYIPFFYDGKVVFAISTELKTDYHFGYENIIEPLRESDFEKAVIIYDRDRVYLCDGEQAVVLWNLNNTFGERGVLLDKSGSIVLDCSELEYCDLTVEYSLIKP